MLIRILASLILLFSVLFMPIWVSAVLALAGMAYFQFYIEAVGLFLLSDLLYGVKEARFSGIVFVSFIISMMAFVIIEIFKTKLKFYQTL